MIDKHEINAFGLKIHPWTVEDTINTIEQNIKDPNTSLQHIVVNAAKIVNAQKNDELKKAINNSDMVNIDGMAVVWALRLLGHEVPGRVAGCDLFLDLVKLSSDKGYKPYFLGAKPDVIEKMVELFKQQYPSLNIAGFHHGYFTDSESKTIAMNIKESRADMLFLGITSPKKEMFLDNYTDLMDVPFSMGVGGSFDIAAGITLRAPKWMQDYGLEWLYRIYQEPRRMWKRYAVTNTIFIWMIFREVLKKKLFKREV